MGCFSCLSDRRRDGNKIEDSTGIQSSAHCVVKSSANGKVMASFDSNGKDANVKNSSSVQSFTFHELAVACQNFTTANLIGEGGFGKVYKGHLETGQVVAIKQLNQNGLQGNQEFVVEVLMLSHLNHSNLVNLAGYCANGDQRLLVYEYMPMGSLENHLFDLHSGKEALEWNTRIKVAVGAARGLEYLHDKVNPPVIYRDLKSANILLDNNFNPKLSDFGLAKLGPVGDKTHVSTRVMGTYGYCAPEYAMTGKLTLKSDIYSFGVVLLELITGRKAFDSSKPSGESSLVAWSRPYFRDRKRFCQLVDPMLKGRYSFRSLHQAIAITAMCLQEQPIVRPLIGDMVVALEYLDSQLVTSGEYLGSGGIHSPSASSSTSHCFSSTSQESDNRRSSAST